MKKTLFIAALSALALPGIVSAVEPRITFAQDTIKDLRERARFPEWSQPIAAGAMDPLLADRLPTKQSLAGPQGAAPTLSTWASSISARAGETVDVFAELSALQPDTTNVLEVLRANSQKLNADMSAQLVNEAGVVLADVVYADNGQGADAQAGDGIYSGRVTLPAALAPALGTAHSLMLTVTAALPNGEQRKAVGGFQYSNPGAVLTGKYRDLIRNGNLVLQAEADVLNAGRYHLTGTLANPSGTPLASAQAAQVFTNTGKQWMDLTFYGLVLREAGALGKLNLNAVALTSASSMPNALGPVLKNAHVTQAINPLLLTAQPFNNPELIETAKRLEATLPLLQ